MSGHLLSFEIFRIDWFSGLVTHRVGFKLDSGQMEVSNVKKVMDG